MNDRRWTVMCGVAGAVLAVALSWDFFTSSLDPWPDQAWILLAAQRHHRGLGLTTTLEAASDDLAITAYRHLAYFPPGYPLLVSLLLATGLSISAIVKAINAVALIVGLCGWMWLAGRVLTSRAAQLLFALLLVLACRGTIPRGGTTDYVFWAILPFWCLLMMAGTAEKRVRWLVAAGALVALMIGFRWAAVIIVPAGAAMILLDAAGSIRSRFAAAVSYALIPTATFGAISLINRALSGNASSILSYVERSSRFDLLATSYPLEAAISRPMAIEPLLARFWRALHPPADDFVFRLVIPIVFIALLMLLGQPKRVLATRFSHIVAFVYIALVGLLAFMTVRHNWSNVTWSFLEEPRYYLPFFPAFALFWLSMGESIRGRGARTAWIALLAVAVLYVGQAEIRWTLKRLREGDADTSLLSQLRAIAQKEGGRSVVFDIDVSRYLLWDSGRFSPRLYPDPSSTARLRTTRPVDVWLVERNRQTTAYVTDAQFDRKRLDALFRRFRPAMVWSSTDGRFRLYHAVAGP